MPKIGLDPGHGGKDPGAIGLKGTKEKDVTLAIARMVRDLLFWMGYGVSVMTREGDQTVKLEERVRILNKENVDLAVSIHCNSSENRNANYVATFIYNIGSQAEKLAQYIQSQLVTATKWPDGGVRTEKFYVLSDSEVIDFDVLRMTNAPTVLIEAGFISNPEQEDALLKHEVREMIASAIASAISKYIKNTFPQPELPTDNIEPWAKDAVLKAVSMKLTDGRDLTRTEQRVLVWFDRLGLLSQGHPVSPGETES